MAWQRAQKMQIWASSPTGGLALFLAPVKLFATCEYAYIRAVAEKSG
jgi:hypothetical protein